MVAKTPQRTQVPILYVRETGRGDAVVLLHGLFGQGSNLGALARSLQDDYHVFSPDLPAHGRSGTPASLDLPGMAEVIQRELQGRDIARVHLVGHSLGGKVAMQLALTQPSLVASLVVADIAPVAYPGSHDAVFAGLHAVAQAACESRQEAQQLLQQHVQEAQVVQFLLSSLRRNAQGQYQWLLDYEAIHQAYPDLLSAPVGAGVYGGPVLFIKGAASAYIKQVHRAAIEGCFPAARLRVMAGCGHWLHAEKPDLFNSIVRRFLSRG